MLPKVECVKYELEIPELNKTIQYRAFSTKEYKLILQAIEDDDPSATMAVILDTVSACTFGGVDVNQIPTHIVDWIYLHIHLKSTGRDQYATYTCNHLKEDGSRCDGVFQIKVPMENAQIVYPDHYADNKVIMVDKKKKVGIKLKCPNFASLKKIDTTQPLIDITDQFVMACIDSIFTDTTVLVPGKDFTVEEAVEWLDNLDGQVIKKISEFFRSMPYLGLDVPITCPICKNSEVVKLKGIEDFFG